MKQKSIPPIIFCVIMITSLFLTPVGLVNHNTNSQIPGDEAPLMFPIDNIETSEHELRTVRVAVYNEPDTTLTYATYATGGIYTNNYANVVSLLEGANFDVTTLTQDDILNHELLTANFDVFVLVDNLPRDNISNYVLDFWLGGGGILSFNSAFGYLNYFGIIDPIYANDFGLVPYSGNPTWVYDSWVNHEIGARHSSAKSYHIGDIITETVTTQIGINVMGLSAQIGSDYVSLASQQNNGLTGVACAIDNYNRPGGKIVQLPGNCSTIPTWQHSVIEDAVDWLCPKPKARIAFDLSHQPRLGVDDWDDEAQFPGYYSEFRNLLVNHSHTFDKLHASPDGNLTSDRISDYDLLIIVLPDYNFTQTEVDNLITWVNGGGALFLFGEAATGSYLKGDDQLNRVLSPMAMQINITSYTSSSVTADRNATHLTTESCSTGLSISDRGYINTTSGANTIWKYWGDVLLAEQEYGQGRVIVGADMNWATNAEIVSLANGRFALNAINWLTSANAEALVYLDGPVQFGSDSQYYKGAIANALNDLGISFYITSHGGFYEQSLINYEWSLVIHDANNGEPLFVHDELIEFIEEGGMFIAHSFYMYADEPLWNYIGINRNGSAIAAGAPDIYPWDSDPGIFTTPNFYNEPNLESSSNLVVTDYSFAEPHANATGIAGITSAYEGNTSAIIVSNEVKAIANTFALSQYLQDFDDSTYPDNFEIWQNEIAYLYYDHPTVNHPDDLVFEGGISNQNWTWTPSSPMPNRYSIKQNSVTIESGIWDGSSIFVSADDFLPGYYEVKLTVWDDLGYTATDIVTINVTDSIAPTIGNPGDIEYELGETGNYINWTGSEIFPDYYRIYIDDVPRLSHSWDGSNIVFSVDGFEAGNYTVKLVLYDTVGHAISDSVIVTVVPLDTTTTETTTTETTPTNTTPTNATTPDDFNLLLVVAVVGAAGIAVVIIVIIIMKKKKT